MPKTYVPVGTVTSVRRKRHEIRSDGSNRIVNGSMIRVGDYGESFMVTQLEVVRLGDRPILELHRRFPVGSVVYLEQNAH